MAVETTLSPQYLGVIFGIVIIALLLALVLLGFWIFTIIHCLFSRRLTVVQKLFWLVVLLIFSIIGSVLYILFARIGGKKMAKQFKGKRLTRSKNRILGGVCAGIGEYLDVDPTVIRLIWVVLVFVSFGAAVLAYVIAWIVIPEK